MKNNNQTKQDDLAITGCKIFTILGEGNKGKQIYANGVMDIQLDLVMTFNRDLTREEQEYYQDNISRNSPIQCGYWDKATSTFIPNGRGISANNQEMYIMEEPGFYIGLYENRDKTKFMIHQYTLEEQNSLKNEKADILERIKNNGHNYYEAYGNKVAPNQALTSVTVRAGVGTLSNTISFKITIQNGEEIFTHDSTVAAYATLELICLTSPSVAPQDSGLQIMTDARNIPITYYPNHMYHTTASISTVAIDKLLYAGTGINVEPFIIYSPNAELNKAHNDAKYDDPIRGMHPELFAIKPATRVHALNNAYIYRAKAISGLEERYLSGKKSFCAWNPIRIFNIDGKWGVLGESAKNSRFLISQFNSQHISVVSDDIPDSEVYGFYPIKKYTPNLTITWICVRESEKNPDNYFSRPTADKFPLSYTGESTYLVNIPMIIMDRFGNRHSLTLKDAITFETPNEVLPTNAAVNLRIE